VARTIVIPCARRARKEVAMVSIPSLWLPILLSAVFVFFVSWLIHMLLPYHRTDFKKLPSEPEIQEALRKFKLEPGDYMLPCGTGPESMKDPAFLEKMKQGPVAIITVMKSGSVNLGPSLAQWFAYCLIVGVLAAYVTGRALPAGTAYLQVFRFAGATAFIAYSVALWQDSIWYKKSWATTFKNTIDGLIYGCLTAGTFGWLWPR
jgi:hypothetical protein